MQAKSRGIPIAYKQVKCYFAERSCPWFIIILVVLGKDSTSLFFC